MIGSLSEFLISPPRLAVYHGEELAFESDASDLRALVEYLNRFGLDNEDVTFFDKYIGRAAAKLMMLVAPVQVYAGIISEGGREVLDQHGVPWQAKEQVKYLMGVASDGMCRWEKLALHNSPIQLLEILRSDYSQQ